MNLDELPLDVLLTLAAVAWLGYGLLLLIRMCAERSEYGVLDHEVGDHDADHSTDDPDHDGRERCVIHARSVHPSPDAPGQGQP